MQIAGTRFGTIEVEDARIINFPKGLIGFPQLTRFVLLEHGKAGKVGWLQSIDAPPMAFPVVDASSIGGDYPGQPVANLASTAGLPANDAPCTLVVVRARAGEPLMANLVAPIVIDDASLTGAQVVIDARRYGASVAVAV